MIAWWQIYNCHSKGLSPSRQTWLSGSVHFARLTSLVVRVIEFHHWWASWLERQGIANLRKTVLVLHPIHTKQIITLLRQNINRSKLNAKNGVGRMLSEHKRTFWGSSLSREAFDGWTLKCSSRRTYLPSWPLFFHLPQKSLDSFAPKQFKSGHPVLAEMEHVNAYTCLLTRCKSTSVEGM